MGTLVNVDDYCLDIFPVDGDVLSLEHPLAFRVVPAIMYCPNRQHQRCVLGVLPGRRFNVYVLCCSSYHATTDSLWHYSTDLWQGILCSCRCRPGSELVGKVADLCVYGIACC